MLVLRSVYDLLKEEKQALQKQHDALKNEHEQLQAKCEQLEQVKIDQAVAIAGHIVVLSAHTALVDDMLAFLKALEPSKAKGAAEMKKQRDALVAKVEQAMQGESEVEE